MSTLQNPDNYFHMLLTFLLDSVAQEDKTLWELRYPLTGKLVTERDMISLIKKLNKRFEDMQNEFPEPLTFEDENILEPGDIREGLAQVPIYEPAQYDFGSEEASREANQEAKLKSRLKFQKVVRKFIRDSQPSQQLALLNSVQKNTKWSLFNPMQKKPKQETAFNKLRYGYADLLRFLCDPVKSGTVQRLTRANPTGYKYVIDDDEGEYAYNGKEYIKWDPIKHTGMHKYRKVQTVNPFYQPILYDVPDEDANERLENLYKGARKYYKKKLDELNYLHKELERSESKEHRKRIIENILLIYRQIYDNRFDPIHLSKQIKGQERPIETYRQEHFNETLQQLVTRNKLAPGTFRAKPPGRTGVEINPNLAIMKQLDKVRNQKKKKRSSRKHEAVEVSSE